MYHVSRCTLIIHNEHITPTDKCSKRLEGEKLALCIANHVKTDDQYGHLFRSILLPPGPDLKADRR